VAEERGLEGVVSKRRKAPYRSGECRDWRKIKIVAWQVLRSALFPLLIASFPSDRIYVWPWRHLTAFVFEGDTDLVASRPGGLLGLSNRLILPDQKFTIDNRLTACLAC